MKRTIAYISILVLTALTFVSCNTGGTLQGYYVENQERPNFITVDIPPSIMSLDESAFTEEQKVAYSSVEKLNFLGYRVDGTDKVTYETELNKVKAILKNPKYNDLMEFSDKAGKIVVKYIGDDDSADEFIVFGSNSDTGFGIVRILGDNMKPEQIATLVDAVQNANFDQSKLQGMAEFFK